jgi:hypothetical protein
MTGTQLPTGAQTIECLVIAVVVARTTNSQ